MILSNLSKRLKFLIDGEDKTLFELGELFGCSEATLSRYINGKSLPAVEIAVNMACYFECSLDYLLGRNDDDSVVKLSATYPPFGKRLIEMCKEKQISRYSLQKLTDIPESVMRYWVKGKTKPSLVNIVKIADALKLSVDYVLGREK